MVIDPTRTGNSSILGLEFSYFVLLRGYSILYRCGLNVCAVFLLFARVRLARTGILTWITSNCFFTISLFSPFGIIVALLIIPVLVPSTVLVVGSITG